MLLENDHLNGRQWLWNFLLKDFWQLLLAKCSQTDGSVKEIFIYDSWNCLVCRHKNKKGKITEKPIGGGDTWLGPVSWYSASVKMMLV